MILRLIVTPFLIDGPTPMSFQYQFAQFHFDPVSGLLVADTSGGGEQVRLQPQPARLLTLLLQRAPEIVTREQIREELWPDVHVDFDRNLHFCVRQIRSALGESAAEPRFIETIPRRGYQWLTQVATSTRDAVDNRAHKNGSSSVAAISRTSRLRAVAMFALIAVGCGLAYLPGTPASSSSTMASGGAGEPATGTREQRAIRIAILPFESAAIESGTLANNGIAELLVDELTNRTDVVFEVIGPTTTERYSSRETPLFQLSNDYDIDVLLNGRIIPTATGARLLAEVIRGTDGAHVWTRMFTVEELQQSDIDTTVCREMLTGLDKSLPLIAQ